MWYTRKVVSLFSRILLLFLMFSNMKLILIMMMKHSENHNWEIAIYFSQGSNYSAVVVILTRRFIGDILESSFRWRSVDCFSFESGQYPVYGLGQTSSKICIISLTQKLIVKNWHLVNVITELTVCYRSLSFSCSFDYTLINPRYRVCEENPNIRSYWKLNNNTIDG